MVEELQGTESPPWQKLAVHLNSKSPQELEDITTILLLRDGGKADDDLAQSFRDVKPKFESDFEARLKELETLETEFAHLKQ